MVRAITGNCGAGREYRGRASNYVSCHRNRTAIAIPALTEEPMNPFIAAAFVLLLASPALAQSETARAGGGEFSGFKTYWAEHREGCQPMISFSVKNISSGTIGPIEMRMEVLDKDKKSIFASGSATLAPADLPRGGTK